MLLDALAQDIQLTRAGPARNRFELSELDLRVSESVSESRLFEEVKQDTSNHALSCSFQAPR